MVVNLRPHLDQQMRQPLRFESFDADANYRWGCCIGHGKMGMEIRIECAANSLLLPSQCLEFRHPWHGSCLFRQHERHPSLFGSGFERPSADILDRVGVVSSRLTRQPLILQTTGGEFERLSYILRLELGILLTQIILIGIKRDCFDNAPNGDSHIKNGRLAIQNGRV